MKTHALLVLCLGVTSILGCGGGENRLEKQVGKHRVSFVPPSEWQYYDHGRQQAFEREDARIVMIDLGIRRPPEVGGATLEEWLEYDWRRMDKATQRAVAARDSFVRGEHSIFVIDTWDRLTHEWRRRHVIVLNGESHLAIYAERGEWEPTRDTIDELVESLRFVESPASEAVDTGEED